MATKKYHCIHCGRELRPMLIWNCPDDNDVLKSGQVLHIDHGHEPDKPYDSTQQSEPIIFTEWKHNP